MSAIKLASILLITCVAALVSQVEPKSIFDIGMRIAGDQLLLKDVLQARSNGLDESATIGFSYAIPEPITYIEILSDEKILAQVNFRYHHDDFLKGTILEIHTKNSIETTTTRDLVAQPRIYEYTIMIYGFNETILDVNLGHIINRYQNYEGFLQPQQDDENLDDEYEFSNQTHYEDYELYSEQNHSNNYLEEDEDDNEDEEEDMDSDATDFDIADKTIEVGYRQQGDYLLYSTMQTSTSSSSMEAPRNHSVVFYYIDRNFITYAEFVIYDHYIDKSINDDYIPPIAEYTHYSPNTLKAIITDHNKTSLIVQMYLYGYRPTDLPDAYKSWMHRLLKQREDSETVEAPNPSSSAEEEDKDATVGNATITICLERAVMTDAATMSFSFLSILSRLLPMGGTASGATFWSAVISLCLVGGVAPALRQI